MTTMATRKTTPMTRVIISMNATLRITLAVRSGLLRKKTTYVVRAASGV